MRFAKALLVAAAVSLLSATTTAQDFLFDCPNGQCTRPQTVQRSVTRTRTRTAAPRQVVQTQAPTIVWPATPPTVVVTAPRRVVRRVVVRRQPAQFVWEVSCPCENCDCDPENCPCAVPTEVIEKPVEATPTPAVETTTVVASPVVVATAVVEAPRRRLRERPLFTRYREVQETQPVQYVDANGYVYTGTETTTSLRERSRYRVFDGTGWRPGKALRTRRMNVKMRRGR